MFRRWSIPQLVQLGSQIIAAIHCKTSCFQSIHRFSCRIVYAPTPCVYLRTCFPRWGASKWTLCPLCPFAWCRGQRYAETAGTENKIVPKCAMFLPESLLQACSTDLVPCYFLKTSALLHLITHHLFRPWTSPGVKHVSVHLQGTADVKSSGFR